MVKTSYSSDEDLDQTPGSERTPRRIRRRSSLRYTEGINYPKAVIFIISNEFCERFTYYGMTTILSLYLKNELEFSDSLATVIYHVFVMLCYFFPLLGAIIADSWLGKYKTILYLSIVYASGDTIISIAAIPGVPAVAFTMIGLFLIAAGTGSIKPCVSAFGGDQFAVPEQESFLKKFFSIFYFTINAGSFISSILTPLLRQVDCMGEKTCYSLGFGVPALLMITSIVIFVSGTKFYKRRKPDGNVIWNLLKCIVYAIKMRKKSGGHWLDKAADKYDPAFIEDVKATLRILVLYIPLPFFWALFDQQGSRWTFQASRMNGDIGAMKINPDQMQVLNPILILVFIPLFEAFVYPGFARYNLLKRPLQKLTVGGLLAAVAFVVSAVVEYKLEETYPVLPKPGEAQIRVYNGLAETLNLNFLDPNYKPESIESMGFWRMYDVPAKGEANIKVSYTVAGAEKTQTLSVTEKTLTSYIVTPEDVIQIPNDDMDKSEEGYPKVMIIYSVPTKETNLSMKGCEVDHVFTVTKAKPFTKYEEFEECETFFIEYNGKTVVENMTLKLGGVYVVLVLDNGGSPKAQLLTVIQPNSLHMLWLVPQYVLITAAEVMFSITGLEFSFTQAPISMKSVLQAAWLLTVAVGNCIVAIIAQTKIFERLLYEFLLFAGLMAMDMFVFALMAMRYKYVVVKDPQFADEVKGPIK